MDRRAFYRVNAHHINMLDSGTWGHSLTHTHVMPATVPFPSLGSTSHEANTPFTPIPTRARNLESHLLSHCTARGDRTRERGTCGQPRASRAQTTTAHRPPRTCCALSQPHSLPALTLCLPVSRHEDKVSSEAMRCSCVLGCGPAIVPGLRGPPATWPTCHVARLPSPSTHQQHHNTPSLPEHTLPQL